MLTLNAPQLTGQAPELFESFQALIRGVEGALVSGTAAHKVKQGVLNSLLSLGCKTIEAFFAASGDGNRRESLSMDNRHVLKRLTPRSRFTDVFGIYWVNSSFTDSYCRCCGRARQVVQDVDGLSISAKTQ